MSRLATARANLSRLWRLIAVCLRHAFGYLLAGRRAGRWRWLAKRLPPRELSGPERLRALFEDLGGTFVKLGQMLALQPDIVSLEYCNALFKLLDRVEPFPFSEVERICREEWGRPLHEVFDDFERRELATASVGQVHVAHLAGRKVAVKVQRPTVEAEFGADIRLMVLFITAIRVLRLRFLSWLLEPLTEFVLWTREELDYRNEARYSERLRGHAEQNPAQHVPKVATELTTRRTLVVDFLEGVTLLDYLRAREVGDEVAVRRLEPPGFDRKRFAANVIDNFLGDAFENGVYHADLHPANLMILPDSVVGYIDFGITGVMSRHGRRHLVAMTLALTDGDMDVLNREFLEVAAWDPQADPVAFRSGLDALAERWYDEEVDGRRRLKVNFTRIMGEMLVLSRRTHVLPERDIVKYIRSAIAIDGLVTRFEPDFDVGRYLATSCADFLAWQDRRERFSPERLLDASAAGGILLRDGPSRASVLLDRLAAGELPARAETPPPASRRARVLALAAAALIAALTLGPAPTAAGGAGAAFGFDLWTVQLAFVAVAIALLAFNLWRLERRPREV